MAKMAGKDEFGCSKMEPPNNAPTLAEMGVDIKSQARVASYLAIVACFWPFFSFSKTSGASAFTFSAWLTYR